MTADIERSPYTRTRRVRFAPDPEDVGRALAMMRESHRPLIYAGGGSLNADATEELKTLADTYAIPVMTTLVAKGVVPENHPFCLGLGGVSPSGLQYPAGPEVRRGC